MSFKKTALATAMITMLGASTTALAAYALPAAEPAPVETGNWYFSALGGAAFTLDNNTIATGTPRLDFEDVGFDASGAFGYRSGPFRYELQYLFVRTTHKTLATVANSGETDLHAGFLNMFYTFNSISDYMMPYIGAGIGIGHITTTQLGLTQKDDTEFAYQGAAGMIFSVDNDFDLDLSYRYVGTAKADKLFTTRYQSHTVNLGITYHIA